MARDRGDPSIMRGRCERATWGSVPSRHFVAVAECYYKTGRVDPALDNVLRGNACNTCIDKFS